MKPLLLYQKKLFIFFWFLIIPTFSLLSQVKGGCSSTEKSWEIKPFERKSFIENKGQFENKLPPEKKMFTYCIDRGYQVFFYTNEICYRFSVPVKAKNTLRTTFESEEKREARAREFKTETQYISVKWLNANPNATIVVEGKQSTYYSYLINKNNEKPNTVMCDGYSKLIYKNLYAGIDVEYIFHPDNGIKYNLIVHAGADISKVQMQYNSAGTIFEKGGDIHIQTLAGDIIDHAPVTFYANSKEKILSSFNIRNHIITFNISPYLKEQEIIIDPWTVIPGFIPSRAFDNGVDMNGNIYIYGGTPGHFVAEKYNATGGAPLWSLVNALDVPNDLGGFYGDLLVEGNGDFYLSQGFVTSGAHVFKFSPTSGLIWQSTKDPNYLEHWRLALNCITNKVIVAGGGTTTPTLNIAEIDVNTGVLINALSTYPGHEDVAGLCVDEFGKSYLMGAVSNKLVFTDSANNPIASTSSGYGLSELAVPYTFSCANGYNFMALGGTTFLFTSDGSKVKKWDRNTHALLGTVTIPGGQLQRGSGILADKCNNLFVGASNGVYRFDFNLVQKEYKASAAAVYDIAYALNSDIVACGNGFLTTFPFGREACGANTILFNSDPCNPEINTIKVIPTQGIPPFSFFWDDGNTDSIRTNLLLGDHIVTVRDGGCSPSFYTDTVTVSDDTKALSVQKINPLCNSGTTGEIIVTLLKNQKITNVIWTPALTSPLLNDSTTKVQGLISGTYNCHVTSDIGCSFDTAITLMDPPQLLDSLKGINAKCPGDTNGLAIVFAFGGTGSFTYSWDMNPLQTTQIANGLTVGQHIVSITDSNSCVKKDSILIGSNPLPVAGFTSQAVCVGDTTTLINTSAIAAGGFNSFWLLGCNGANATSNTTKYAYPLCNNYIPTLIVTSDSGCVSTFTDTVVVYCKPTALFTVNNVCTYQAALFTNNSTGAVSYSWDFDYNTGIDNTSLSPTHLYQPGIYNVQLIAHSGFGCSDTVVNNVVVYNKPLADFVAGSVCLGDAIVFSDLSAVVGDTVTSWSWNFEVGSPLNTIQNPSHNYSNSGTFPVVLITGSDKGCKDTVTKNVVVHPLPNPLFSATNVCDGINVQLNNFSTIPASDTIQSYSWNFGDGTTINTATAHLYAGAGTYTVQLLAVSNFGCTDSLSKTVAINPNPVIHFTAVDTVGCEPLCVNFQNLSTVATGSNINCFWNFGDGGSINSAQNPNHCYTNDSVFAPTSYSVSLTVTSDSGCISALTKNNYITVYPKPVASFTVHPETTSIIDPVISITDLSLGANFWNWNFGDLDSSSVSNPPPHTYADTGTYLITLTVSTQYACTDVDYHTVIVEPDFLFYVPNAFTPNGDGINDSFIGRGVFIKAFEMRIFDRWGNLIYKTVDINKPWDGKANDGNDVAQEDVYVYAIRVTDIKGKKHNYRGHVTLVR